MLSVLAAGFLGAAVLELVFALGFEPVLAGLVAGLAADLVAGFVAAVALGSALGLFAAASLAASALSSAAWRWAASSSRWRSVLASFSAFLTAAAALLPLSTMSAMRRTWSSWRWPFLTRRRALGRYLNEMTFSPRSWRRTSALTLASLTTGRPIVAASPSATRRTRSMVTVSPALASISSTSSWVPTSTRYCFPPVSMTAYMDPRGLRGAAGGGLVLETG